MAANRGRQHMCPYCGRVFFSYANNAIYDVNACRQAAYRDRKAEFKRAIRRFSAELENYLGRSELQQRVFSSPDREHVSV